MDAQLPRITCQVPPRWLDPRAARILASEKLLSGEEETEIPDYFIDSAFLS